MNEKIGLPFWFLAPLFIDSSFPARHDWVSLCFDSCFAIDLTVDSPEYIDAVPCPAERDAGQLPSENG
jgi:hypothetical protein